MGERDDRSGGESDRAGSGDDRSESGAGDGRYDEANGDGNGGDRSEGPSTAEKTLTAISIAFTLLLFGFVAWQAVQPPTGGQPQAEVLGTEEASNGSVLVTVELTNPGSAGLISATVESDCTRPPTETRFSYVPAGDREQAILVCPSGTTRANVSVSSWVPT